MMNLTEIGMIAWGIAEDAGWHDRSTGDADRIGLNLALVHSEVSEALEAYRKDGVRGYVEVDGKPEGWGSELADTIIRVCELAHMTGVDLALVTEQKMEYNRRRNDVPRGTDTRKRF